MSSFVFHAANKYSVLWSHRHCVTWKCSFCHCSVQFMRSEESMCAPPHLSEVSKTFPLKQLNSWLAMSECTATLNFRHCFVTFSISMYILCAVFCSAIWATGLALYKFPLPLLLLTPSLPWYRLKMVNEKAKSETLKPVLFRTGMWKDFHQNRQHWKQTLKDRKIYYLQARPWDIQPGNFTGWGSEGVNRVHVVSL